MTQKTKLEIIGEYREDHPGPFCTREGSPVRLLTKTDGHQSFPIVGFNGEEKNPTTWCANGRFQGDSRKDAWDLMCAREVPVAREFWVNEYHGGNRVVYDSPEKAQEFQVCLKRTIHMIEVLPGEGA